MHILFIYQAVTMTQLIHDSTIATHNSNPFTYTTTIDTASAHARKHTQQRDTLAPSFRNQGTAR